MKSICMCYSDVIRASGSNNLADGGAWGKIFWIREMSFRPLGIIYFYKIGHVDLKREADARGKILPTLMPELWWRSLTRLFVSIF